MRQVLITGGAGFLGSHLCQYHLERGDSVCIIDDLSTGLIANLGQYRDHPHLTTYFESLVTCKNLTHILEPMEIVYHFAAVVGVFRVLERPEQVLSVNIGGTQRLLQTMQSIQSQARLLIASTSEVYGHGVQEKLIEDRDVIISTRQSHRMNYPISKLVDEAYAMTYYEAYGLRLSVLRIFNVIGPGQSGYYGMVVPRFIQAAVAHQDLEIYGNGHQRRSFCDVRDFVNLVIQLIDCSKAIGQIINIGHEEEISILDLAHLVIHVAKSQSSLKFLSYEQAYHEYVEEFMFRRPDLSKLKSLIKVRYDWQLIETIEDLITKMRSG